MAIKLKTPWSGYPTGKVLSLSPVDEASLIRADAAERHVDEAQEPSLFDLIEQRQPTDAPAPTAAPVKKPAPWRSAK